MLFVDPAVVAEPTGTCLGTYEFPTGGCCENLNCAVVDANGAVCYCDQECHQFGDCCSDIAALPCLRKSVAS